MVDLLKIVGLTVFAIKGEFKSKGKFIEPKYVLFSDNETYIEFEDQDPYSFREAAFSAKHIRTYKDEVMWKIISEYSNANADF